MKIFTLMLFIAVSGGSAFAKNKEKRVPSAAGSTGITITGREAKALFELSPGDCAGGKCEGDGVAKVWCSGKRNSDGEPEDMKCTIVPIKDYSQSEMCEKYNCWSAEFPKK